jgi:SAM-dependent methyltransferase
MELPMSLLRSARRILWSLDNRLARMDRKPDEPERVPPAERYEEIKAFARSVDLPDDAARAYREQHLHRVARTLTLVPPPGKTGRVLELGAYMQMTPALGCVLGYREVRGGYYGPLGRTDTKTASVSGKVVFRCEVDHFDAERDRFPYPDNSFDCVLACEIIEHLLHDPMHMLLEIQRVLVDGGTMVLTTPNTASFTSVAKVLEFKGNPQLFAQYPNPQGADADKEIPHVREYIPWELADAVKAAGFTVDWLFTENIAGNHSDEYIRPFLKWHGFPVNLRGEQLFCVARKQQGAAITRYPWFLYEGC